MLVTELVGAWACIKSAVQLLKDNILLVADSATIFPPLTLLLFVNVQAILFCMTLYNGLSPHYFYSGSYFLGKLIRSLIGLLGMLGLADKSLLARILMAPKDVQFFSGRGGMLFLFSLWQRHVRTVP